jgi:hypothetical protein
MSVNAWLEKKFRSLFTDGRSAASWRREAELLQRQVDELHQHIDALTDLDKFDVRATKMGVEGVVKGAGAGLLAAILAKPLFDLDAENYVEQRFYTKNPKTGVRMELVHTIQKVTGKTPHEKRQQAEEALGKIVNLAIPGMGTEAEIRDIALAALGLGDAP